MQKTGFANLPLHGGKCPGWLFPRMRRLAGAISETLIYEFGEDEFLRRLSNPFWFQSLSCVIGFDWHSSGTTTTTCGALKESLNKLNLGIKVAGGKGNTSRKAPAEIQNIANNFNLSENKTNNLVYSSKMSAKVDNALIQDNYNLYHHCFFLTEKGKWTVIQQGMFNTYARRYHWLSDNIKSFVEEPHEAICCDNKQNNTLNMTAKESKDSRNISLDLINDNPEHLKKYINQPQTTLNDFNNPQSFSMFPRHDIIGTEELNMKSLKKAYELQPKTYEELVAIKGIGPKSIRSLALISDLIYGKPASWKDPVKYSFAHGGKDGFPYPVNKKIMDSSTSLLKDAIKQAKLNQKDRLYAIKRLEKYYN
ncbi:DUF763 domain-containing protein [Candidatus Woesearchaeota archaeon]|nr:DUF763 domain-containing protein [Candidatus Woesearchaeota archaeon]